VSTAKYNAASAGSRIESFLTKVLDAAGLKVGFELLDGDDVRAYFEAPSLVVKFEGKDVDYLTANKGEALIALEHLTQEMLRMAPDEHAHICFDANDFRLLRMEELRLSALTVAERVKETRTPYRFSPMSSRERRILHLALRGEETLRSESSGTGQFRHVVVYPAGMASLPELPPPPPTPMRRPGPGGDRDRDRSRGGPPRRDRDRGRRR
jgi:spoIIIJ-associated protein